MEGFEKGLAPSKSTASPKPSSTGSGENNENDIPQFQSHKKIVAKHFMSPTISAASKAAAPRKKILAERLEVSSNSDAQNHKTKKKSKRNSSISHFYQSTSRIVSSCDHVSETDDDLDTDFLDDSSVKAYDPVKNYLSPRPKYLRFNPNRRREIFSRLETEDLNGSFDSQELNDEVESDEIKDSSFSPLKESVVKRKNEENTKEEDENNFDDYEEEEEVEEERGWCIRGVLKLVLTLIACVLSTSYICSMNSPTHSTTRQAIWDFKYGCLMIKRQTLEIIGMKLQDAGFLKMEVGENYGDIEDVEFDGDQNGESEESPETKIDEDDENLERVDKELVENEKVIGMKMQDADFLKVEGGESYGEVEEVEINKDENGENEESVEAEIVEDVENLESFDKELVENGNGDGEFELKADNFDDLVDAKNDGSIDGDGFCSEKEVESSYPALNEDNVEKTEEAAETEIETEKESYVQSIGAKTDESEESITKETPQESKVVDDMDLAEELVGLHEIDEVEKEKVGWNTSAVFIGFSVVSIILTSAAVFYRLKKRRSAHIEESEPVLKPHKLAVEKKVTLPSVERKVEFFARPSLLSHSMQEAPRKHIGAPTVELIGEITVGRKYQTESKESINDTFFPKNDCKLPQPLYAPTHPSSVEYSTTSSTSYGSFTTETKISKKEGGQSGEAAMIEVTPVRRSSRLRNRASVMSP